MATFIHAADLHLGLGIARLASEAAAKLHEARFQALENVLERAKQHDVDFLIISGDLFDHSAVDVVTANRAYRLLESAPAPVFVLPGNHDPLVPGGVWDRSPWNTNTSQTIRVLRERTLMSAPANVVLLPCPVERRSSFEDPTNWIEAASGQRNEIRVGVAHGSIRDRVNLPPDDHVIGRDVATIKDIDYLALGHWHNPSVYLDAAGAPRVAYPGVHEPMGFDDSLGSSTGWAPLVSDPDRLEFRGTGEGRALLVEISAPGMAPSVQPIKVGHLTWQNESISLRNGADVSDAIRRIAAMPAPERTVLRLQVDGLLSARELLRIEELEQILNRFVHYDLDRDQLYLQPDEEEIREVARHGVLSLVFEALKRDLAQAGTDMAMTERVRFMVAERALLAMYRVAKEVQK